MKIIMLSIGEQERDLIAIFFMYALKAVAKSRRQYLDRIRLFYKNPTEKQSFPTSI